MKFILFELYQDIDIYKKCYILIYYHSVICMCVFAHKQSLWVHAYIDSISSIIQIWLKVTNKEY